MNRFKWNEYFMLLAKIAALRSGCNSRPTGAVIVKNKRVIATGYNGTLPGKKQCTDNGADFCYRRSIGNSDFGTQKYRDCPSIHAEANALDQILKYGPVIGDKNLHEYSIYCTLYPCIHCLKRIASAGIKTVFYELKYESDDPERDKSWVKKAEEWEIKTYPLTLGHDEYQDIYDRIFTSTSERKLK